MDINLPRYSWALPDGERSLDYVPNAGTPHVSRRTDIKRSCGNYTVTLDAQSDALTYGTASVISGTIHLNKSESVTEVVLKLTGKMKVVISGAGNARVSFLSKSYSLWPISNSRTLSPPPPDISFSIPMPTEFSPRGSTAAKPLPPSLVASALRLYAKISYKISIHVSRTARLRGLYGRKSILNIPFIYVPRLRPSRPIIECPNFLETVKIAPEEWCQVSSELRGKDPSRPLSINVFLPVSNVYSLSDSIPFHIQLIGCHDDTGEFLPPSYSSYLSHTATHVTSQFRSTTSNEPKISVTLVRQMVVEVEGLRGSKDITVGEGELLPLEPTKSTSQHGSCELTMDWTGWVRAAPDVSYGSFSVGELAMKDYVVVTVIPSCESAFKELRIPIPIRLVTDPVQHR
ncbi:hypothetical protein DL96DRAFT_1620547 [Flagelloscypha sp. PMI_526]|nr:hypothetical protein DL96DRAFT_1620547 [Flagelloscypha sp. PMI_526]